VSHLRVFGYIAHVMVARPNLKKLDDSFTPMIFLDMNQAQQLIGVITQTPRVCTSAVM
jgi:hypothetical protein